MPSVDKAAMVWSIAIVAVGAGFAMSAGIALDTGFTSLPTVSTTSDSKIEAAKQQIEMEQKLSMEEERAKAMEEQTGMMGESSVELEETVEQEVELSAPIIEAPQAMRPMSVDVAIPTGTAVPGCDDTNECYIPFEVGVSVGGTVTWSNDDTAAHTVSSGSATSGPDDIFDSGLFKAGATFEVTFDTEGEYPYFCMVHPWMQGNVQVS